MNWSAVAIGGLLGIGLSLFMDLRTPAYDFGYAVGKWSRENDAAWLDFIVITAAGFFLAILFYAVVISIGRALRAIACALAGR